MVELIVVSLSIILTILYGIFGNFVPSGWEKKGFLKCLFIVETFSLLVCVLESFVLEEDPLIIQKPEAGKSEVFEERRLEIDGVLTEDISIEIPARKLTDVEISKAFEQAKDEIDETFRGENQSLDKVSKKIVMNGSYVGGLVLADWRLDNYSFVYTDGELKNEELEEAVENHASVTLSCEGKNEIYEIPFTIVPKIRTGNDKLIYELKMYMASLFERDSTSSFVKLPNSFDKYLLKWEKKQTPKGMIVFLIGVVVVVGLGIGRVEEEKKKMVIRSDELRLAYSDVLSTLTLLLGAGMSVRKAWEKMLLTKKNRAGPLSAVYEEMDITFNQMKTGMSESAALEEFGRRTKLPCYKKMSGLLVGYIQKGSRDITTQLNNEVVIAFEERKALAKIAGELAGTKLLLPMLMLLGVALIIIIVPALLSFSF